MKVHELDHDQKYDLMFQFDEFDLYFKPEDESVHLKIPWLYASQDNKEERIEIRKRKIAVYKMCKVVERVLDNIEDHVNGLQQMISMCVELYELYADHKCEFNVEQLQTHFRPCFQ